MAIAYAKPPLTFDQQLEQLAARGIAIPDRELAARQLSQISYYRLSGYWYFYRRRDAEGNVADAVRDGTTWDTIIRLYEFDRRLRLFTLDAIERIEIATRTQLTYHFAHRYGAFGHTNPDHFHPRFVDTGSPSSHPRWLAVVRGEVRKSRDTFMLHFKEKYDGFPDVPVWMLTEVMSFGGLSRFYKGLQHEDKKPIARHFNLHHKRLAGWLHTLTVIRNICAHHSRLWNRKTPVRPDERPEAEWLPPHTPYRDRIFYVLLMIRHLLRCDGNGDDWAANMDALLEPICENAEWREAMGVPENWKEHPLWRKQ